MLLGAVISAPNAWLPTDALLHCTTVTTPRLVVIDEERADILADKISELEQVGGTRNIVVLRSSKVPHGMLSLDAERVAWEKSGQMDVPEVEVGPEDLATIFFTSGTTGMPKGVVGTNRNYLSNIINSMVCEFLPRSASFLSPSLISFARPPFRSLTLNLRQLVDAPTFVEARTSLLPTPRHPRKPSS